MFDVDAALAAADRAVTLAPQSASAQLVLANVLQDRLQIPEAIAAYRCSLALCAQGPSPAAPHFGLAECLFLDGQQGAAAREYEIYSRLAKDGDFQLTWHGRPRWDGRALDEGGPGEGGLLVICDRGIGDVIQWCRYLPAVAALCPNLIVVCHSALRPMVQQQAGVRHLISDPGWMPNFAAYTPLSRIAALLGSPPSTPFKPYLTSQPVKRAAWKRRLEADTPHGHRRIGVVWAGNPEHGNDFKRSMSLNALAPLAALDHVTLFSLQVGAAREQVAAYRGRAPLIDLGARLGGSFDDAMAIIDNLDLVVSVDTSIAHLAGAMGRPVFMLTCFSPDARWMLNRADTPWYPSLNLVRQDRFGDWSGAVARLVEQIAQPAP